MGFSIEENVECFSNLSMKILWWLMWIIPLSMIKYNIYESCLQQRGAFNGGNKQHILQIN